MKRYLMIYKESIKVAFASASTYRMNFFLNNIIMLIGNIFFPLVTILIYGSGASFEGWTLYEVLLIQSIFTMSMAIADMTFHGILWATMGYVRSGNFEMVLIKPVNTMFLLMAGNFSIDAIGLLMGGITVFIIALSKLTSPTFWMWLRFGAFFLMGLLVMLGIALIMAATSFKWVGNSRIPEIFDSIKNFGKYPQNIFPKIITGVTSFIIPVAMIGYFPAEALLGEVSEVMYMAIIPCIIFAFVGFILYQYMIKLYEGVGG